MESFNIMKPRDQRPERDPAIQKLALLVIRCEELLIAISLSPHPNLQSIILVLNIFDNPTIASQHVFFLALKLEICSLKCFLEIKAIFRNTLRDLSFCDESGFSVKYK